MAMIECDGPPETSKPKRITVANLGDSRTIISRGGQAIQMSDDHKPEVPTERERIERAGGCICEVGAFKRLDGCLTFSRSLGDFAFKAREDLQPSEQKVSVEPETHVLEVTDQDEFLFLGCDGVSELHSPQEVVSSIRAGLQMRKPLREASGGRSR